MITDTCPNVGPDKFTSSISGSSISTTLASAYHITGLIVTFKSAPDIITEALVVVSYYKHDGWKTVDTFLIEVRCGLYICIIFSTRNG